jgi:hypothetical protein
MEQKLSFEILTPNRIGHLFLEYILEKDIPAKVREEVAKKIYFADGRWDEEYFRRLKTEYLKWAKQVDIPMHLKEDGWESYIID